MNGLRTGRTLRGRTLALAASGALAAALLFVALPGSAVPDAASSVAIDRPSPTAASGPRELPLRATLQTADVAMEGLAEERRSARLTSLWHSAPRGLRETRTPELSALPANTLQPTPVTVAFADAGTPTGFIPDHAQAPPAIA